MQRLPENEELVRTYDGWLRANQSRVLDCYARFLSSCEARGEIPLDGVGFPLRPLFLRRSQVDAIGAAISRAVASFAENLRARAREDDYTETALGERWGRLIDVDRVLSDPLTTACMRPDGYLSGDGFHLAELNAGNGLLLSASYCETLRRFYTEGLPVLHETGLNPDCIDRYRPLGALAGLMRQTTGAPRPRIVGVHPKPDLLGIDEWGERVHAYLKNALRWMADYGVDVVPLHEDEIEVSDAVRGPDGKVFDGAFVVTTGVGFFEVEFCESIHSHFRGSQVGPGCPLFVPIGALALEKGCLPAFSRYLNDENIRTLHTERPHRDRAADYRLERERFVIKRAINFKDTSVGRAMAGRPWNRKVERMLAAPAEYVVQEYCELPVTTLPVLTEGAIEWLECQVEVSPFLISGNVNGVMCRYSPVGGSAVLSPPPPDMGFGFAYLS